MPDHQGLTDEQLEFLRSLPKAWRRGVVSPVSGLALAIWVKPHNQEDLGILKRSPTADVLLATLDHHTTKAKEDERRKFENFDFLCDFAAKYLDRHHPSDVPLICDPDSPDPGPRLAAALRDCLAATQSTPKGEGAE